jgi:ATP-dependent DNA helicase PIF1
MYQNILKLKGNPETANVGKRWTDDEVTELLLQRKNDMPLEDIAKFHKRTYSSIKSKLLHYAVSLLDTKSIEEASEIIKLSIPCIKEHMNKENSKKSAVKKEPKLDDMNEKIKSIIDDFSVVTNINSLPYTGKPTINEISLNDEQESALNHFKAGKNIFLTGPAGTGKSVTLSKIREYCNLAKIELGITATTGTAAFLINGKTVHSYLGIGLATESAEEIWKYVRHKLSHIPKKLREIKALIIDEISMLDANLLDKISDYLKFVCKKEKPFGGIQIVLTGDFCQLAPVSGDYAFKSNVWSELNLKIIYLTKLLRQDGDLKFQKILSDARYGYCSAENYKLLSSLSTTEFGEIKPTILYPRNFDVDKINKSESEKLMKSGAKNESYKVEYPNAKYKDKTERWAKSLDIPEIISFCVGDQVVVTANINQDAGIVNGTRGIVIDVNPICVTIRKINDVKIEIRYHESTNVEDPSLRLKFMPLKLAYALSIHKSQGMTLDAVEVDIGPKIFAAGQAYTALSRAQNLESVKVKSIAQKSFIIDPEVLKFYKNIEKEIENKKYIYEKLNLLIYNISNHIQLEKSLDIVWDLIPEKDTELLEYFNEYNQPKVELELKNYQDNKCTELIKKIYKIKKYIDIDFFKNKINELN